MILLVLILGPFFAGVLSWIAGRFSIRAVRWISLVAMFAGFLIAVSLWAVNRHAGLNQWYEEVDWTWLPAWGIRFHLAADGLSVLLLALTYFLGIVSVLVSWTEIQYQVGFFHLNLLWIVTGMAGVFLAVDLFLFYFAWELMLIPIYFLIGIWGHEHRHYAALKFFIFTQLSGLLMLISILSLYFAHHALTGVYTFEYADLLGTPLAPATEMWIMLGFFTAFAVKLPVVPLHTWLPDAHTEAPTAGSVDLAGLLLKTGAYGMIRFAIPLFPHAARAFAPVAMSLGVAGILYGAVLAFSQTDLKRLVACTSVSHMGFVLLGILRLEQPRPGGRGDDHDRPRRQHRRALRDRGRAAGAHSDAGDVPHGRPVGRGAAAERLRAVFRSGLARPARGGRFRGRISGAARHLPG